MKTGMLVLALTLAVASFAGAVTGTIDLYTDYNLVSVPLVPFNPAPATMFSGMTLDGVLSRLDPTTGSDVVYSEWEPDTFGNLLLGDGYWLFSDGGINITYDGVESGVPATSGGPGTDMWISLPGNQYDELGGGWHIIGNPYAGSVHMANFYFTDGVEMKSWQEAYDAGWVSDNFQGYEGIAQSSSVLSIDGWGDVDSFAPARAYYMETYKDNLAMVILAP